jgi:AcrR family transcriptional regulator
MAARAETGVGSVGKGAAAAVASPRGKQRNRHREVLDTATQVFARRGYAAATVQDVADALGMLKGSVYYYINSKEELLFEVLEDIHGEVDALLDEVKAIEGLGSLERLREYVRLQTAYNLRNQVKMSVYYDDLEQLSPERRAQIFKRRHVHEKYVTGLIKQAQREGLIAPELHPEVMANSVFAVIIWPYRWYNARGRLSADNVVSECVEFVMSGLAKR